jgi:hypothetical protein
MQILLTKYTPDYTRPYFTKWVIDGVFTATDGIDYWIDTNSDEISEWNYGYAGGVIDNEMKIDFINENKDRWEVDAE